MNTSDQSSDAPIGIANKPVVSVIIPVYNRAATLQLALNSVDRQTMKNYEIIVVDDGSMDDSANVARSFTELPIRVMRHESRRGAGAARNTGIQNSRGSYIALLDSDDEWIPEKLEKQLQFLNLTARQPIVCCSGYFLCKENIEEVINTNLASGNLAKTLLWGCTLSPGSTLIADQSCFKQVGPFDESLQRLEDWDWLLRCCRLYPVHVVPEPLARIHASPDSINLSHVLEALQRMNAQRAIYGFSWLTPIDLQKFRSTLFLERAAAHYRRGAILSAVSNGSISIVLYPFRNWAFFKKLATILFNWPVTRRPT